MLQYDERKMVHTLLSIKLSREIIFLSRERYDSLLSHQFSSKTTYIVAITAQLNFTGKKAERQAMQP
jgi:hypothetical protein